MNDDFNFDEENDEGCSTSVGEYPPEPIQQPPKRPQKRRPASRRTAAPSEPTVPGFFPMQPKDIRETGLSVSYLEELYLKHLFQAGELRGSEITSRMGLPGGIVDELTQRLRKPRFIDVKGSSGAGVGHSGMILAITEAGQTFVNHALDRDRYIGPAPVTYEAYSNAVIKQTIRGNKLTRDDIKPHFSDLILRNQVFDSIGPAMNSGKALFFYGPPGNGKTAICQRMTNCFGGDIFIPHAIIVDDFVIKVYDSTIHMPAQNEQGSLGNDRRWMRCRRPMVVVGGELVLEDLDLAYSPEVKYYEAPFQMKANNGMLLIDDFGRQKVSPKDLLNRWIVPLESEVDYLSMHTGKKLKVPFDVFVTFSTNLDPESLVDAAFLRRVRYKLEVTRPTPKQFAVIFQRECKKQKVKWEPEMFTYLVRNHYQSRKLPFNACEPRDLLAQVVDLSAYNGHKPTMTEDILDQVVENYFVRFDKREI